MSTPAAPFSWLDQPQADPSSPDQPVSVVVTCVPYSPDIIAVPWPNSTRGSSPAAWLITHAVAGRIPLLCQDLASANCAMSSLDASIRNGSVRPEDPLSVRDWSRWYLENRPEGVQLAGLRESQ